MPEFKVVSGTADAFIQFFEQQLHITFPTHASGGGAGDRGGAAVEQPAPVPPQDIHQANFTVFPSDAGQVLDAINEQLRHAQEMQHQADVNLIHALANAFHWDIA